MSGAEPGYRLVDHTGDLALEIWAPDLEGLHDAAARALFESILDLASVLPADRVVLRVAEAADPADRLVRFLSELLFLHETQDWLFCGAQVLELSDTALVAEGIGERFDSSRHRIERQVKAVTYHRLRLERVEGGLWRASVVLDL
jgi:SHS2 domain-containing protein